MDYEFELEKFNFKSKNELSSFSDACESRLRDRLYSFFHEVRQTGSSEENQNIQTQKGLNCEVRFHLTTSPIVTLNNRIIKSTNVTETTKSMIEYAEPRDQLSFILNH